MNPLETLDHSPHRKGGRLARAVLALAAIALFALAAIASPAGAQMYPATAAKTAKAAPRPVRLNVFSPGVGDTAGQEGAGFVVDLSLTARNLAANSLLAPEAGYKPFFNNPTAPTFKPGPDGGAPGLVVMLSTTPTMPGTPFQGPSTNLAGLFQTNGVGTLKHGLTQTWNTWQIGKAGFGSGPSTLTVFVVKGTAPAVVPATGLDIISNTVKVPFTISTPAAATSPSPAATANATVKVTHDSKLGDILVDTTGRTVYMFEKDQGTMTACTGACAGTWPALKANATTTVGAGLDASKVGSANGQVTYNGHLLYYTRATATRATPSAQASRAGTRSRRPVRQSTPADEQPKTAHTGPVPFPAGARARPAAHDRTVTSVPTESHTAHSNGDHTSIKALAHRGTSCSVRSRSACDTGHQLRAARSATWQPGNSPYTNPHSTHQSIATECLLWVHHTTPSHRTERNSQHRHRPAQNRRSVVAPNDPGRRLGPRQICRSERASLRWLERSRAWSSLIRNARYCYAACSSCGSRSPRSMRTRTGT